MYKVEVCEAAAWNGNGRPYYVKINGITLKSKAGQVVRYVNSIKAAVGGAREVDRLRAIAEARAAKA